LVPLLISFAYSLRINLTKTENLMFIQNLTDVD